MKLRVWFIRREKKRFKGKQHLFTPPRAPLADYSQLSYSHVALNRISVVNQT